MKYYITADIHGYYTELITALTGQGYFEDNEPKKLVILGDLYDRGPEAKKIQDFIMELMNKREVILIRGNHEDLLMEMIADWGYKSYLRGHHISNMIVDTICQLTGYSIYDLNWFADDIYRELQKTPTIRKIIPSMLDFYETEHYIFVHGWIPCYPQRVLGADINFTFEENWRTARPDAWYDARWINGMHAAHEGIVENGKTIVCGHWHASFGHAKYERRGSEHGEDADYSPYYGDGIIAMDACTARSRRVNVIVLED